MRSKNIAIVTDCGGQAKERMATRVYSLFPGAFISSYVCDSLAAAAGNIVDAIHAGSTVVLCNSAPRAAARVQNGDAIVFGRLKDVWIVSTLAVLALIPKFAPDFQVWAIDVDAFMRRYGKTKDTCFNFRGLEVIPLIAQKLCARVNLSRFSKPVKGLPSLRDCVWLVDEIQRLPTNLKLSVLEDEASWYQPGQKVWVKFGGRRAVQIGCYKLLKDVPIGKLGLYKSSSGMWGKHFLEIAVMGGQASRKLRIRRSGVSVTFRA